MSMQANAGGVEFWEAVDELRRSLLHDEKISTLRKQCEHEYDRAAASEAHHKGDKRNRVLASIETVILNLLQTVGKGESPALCYDRSSWDNVRFEENSGLLLIKDASQTCVRFDSLPSMKKFSLMMKVLSIMYKLIQGDTYCTKRDIFYQDAVLFNSQSMVDDVVACISCMLHIPRWELHVLATSKGCVAGDMTFRDSDGSYVKCSSTSGLLVPSHVDGITRLETRAKFVLVVEKDATFQKLLDDEFCKKLEPCILVTGKGFPDVNTRLLLRKIWSQLQIPIFALVDADPHGIEIMAVYRFGSMSLAYESHHLTVPVIRWLGVFPSDIVRFQIPQSMLIPLNLSDINKAAGMMTRPYVTSNQVWTNELQILLRSKVKAEIQSLSAISPRFLSDTYIPGKLQHGGWI